MAIEFACPACGGTLQVGDESAGRVIRCGGCLNALRVPESGSAAPNPYEIDRPAPAPRPASAEPPAAAVPVEPRRRPDPAPYDERPTRRRPDPNDEYDRPRRRRPPPPPPGRGVFFWLVIFGGVMLVGMVVCCGGAFLLLPDAQWRKHESEKGGFRVELPAQAQPDVGKAASIQLERGTKSEGAVILRRAESFIVFYRDVPGTKKRAETVPPETDEQLIKREIDAVRAATQGRDPIRSEPVVVGGFDGRDVEFMGKGGWYTVRVLVADTRLYVLLSCSPTADPGNGDARKFIDSFELTDEKLVEEGKRRAEQAKLAADGAKEARERAAKKPNAGARAEAKGREPEELRAAAESVAGAVVGAAARATAAAREAEELRAAAESVADVATRAGLRAAVPAPPAPRLPVAPPPRPVGG